MDYKYRTIDTETRICGMTWRDAAMILIGITGCFVSLVIAAWVLGIN